MGRFNMISRGAAPVAPVNSVAPVVSGSATQGSTLTSTTGTWSGSPTYAYQWKRAGTNISGATSSTYATVVGDVGSSVTCTVTATNGGGSASAGSNGVTVTAASSFTINASGYGDTFNNAFVPQGLDRLLARSIQAGKTNSAIFPQEECCLPHSAPATSFIIGGTDVASFEQGSAAGSIELTTAALSAVTPGSTLTITYTPVRSGVGNGPTKTISVYLPTNAKSFFVDPAAVANTGVHGSWGDPYKYLPGTADYGGTAKTFTAGDVVFFKAGVHRTALRASKTFSGTFSSIMSHAGSAGNPFILEFNGWGGRAQIVGDEPITGGYTPTQSQANGNASYASLKQFDLTSQGGALELFAGVYDGDASLPNSKLYRAQWPTPVTLGQNRLPDMFQAQGTERFGMRMIPVRLSGGTSRIFTDGALLDGYPAGAGTTVTIVDPGLVTRYGAITVAQLGKVMLLSGGKSLTEVWPTSYDNTTGTIVLTTGASLTTLDGLTSGLGAYAILHNPFDIVQPGQYATSQDGLTTTIWPTNNSTISVSRRYSGADPCMGGYVKYSGGIFARFCNGTSRASGTQSGGAAFHHYSTTGNSLPYLYECDITNAWVRQCYSDDGAAIYGNGSSGAGVSGFRDCNFELILFTEVEANGFRFSCKFEGLRGGGTYSQITAYSRGKIRGNSAPELGINQTFCLLLQSDGAHVTLNNYRGNSHLHGNGISVYNINGSSYFNTYYVVDFNDIVNSTRGFTSDDANSSNRHGFWLSNFVLMSDDRPHGENAGMNLFGGANGDEVGYNLVMNYTNTGYWQAYNIGGGANINFHNNAGGALTLPYPGPGAWTGLANDNYFTNETAIGTDPLTAGGTNTGNVILTGGTTPAHTYVYAGITAGMTAKLGSGRQIGVFRTA